MESIPERSGKNTGWAIGLAVVATIFFYLIYRFVFMFIVDAFASYDPSFSSGLGALILIVFGANVLSFLSGAIVARKVFSEASTSGLFYGLATLLVIIGIASAAREVLRPDGHFLVAGINIAVVAITILIVRVSLFSDDVARGRDR